MAYGQISTGYVTSAMNRVYNYMFLGVLGTAAVAFGVASNTELQMLLLGTALKWVVILAPLACVLIMSFKFDKLSTTTLSLLYGLVVAAFGASLSTIFLTYRIETIGLALFSSSSIFLVMSVYGYFTKKDLSSWGQFLFVGLIALIISQLVNLFIQSSALTMALSAVAVIIFTALTAYDTQRIKEMMISAHTTDQNRLAIMGALSLYLDFLNLFVNLLQLLGGKK